MIIGKASPDDYQKNSDYEWAHDLYDQGIRNTWFPHEIPLKEDLNDFENMNEEEKHALMLILSFMNPMEFVVNKSICLGIYPYIKSPEAHKYLSRQLFEEANHSETFEYILESFPIDRKAMYALHPDTESSRAKEEWISTYINRMTDEKLDIESDEGKRELVRNLVATNIVMEGIFFFTNFMVILAFRQRNKMRNFGSLTNWVLRDESLHLKFGMQLILTILEENEEIVTDEFADEIREMIKTGVELESNFNKDLFPNGVLGMNADYINQYVQYIADRRLEELGFEAEYNVENPAKWMATSTDVLELVNFFEQQNTNYEVNANATVEKATA